MTGEQYEAFTAADDAPSELEASRSALAAAINAAGWTCSGGADEPGKFLDCSECWDAAVELADFLIRSGHRLGAPAARAIRANEATR